MDKLIIKKGGKLVCENTFENYSEALNAFVDRAAYALQREWETTVYLEAGNCALDLTLFPHPVQSVFIIESGDGMFVILYDEESKQYRLFQGFNNLVWTEYDPKEILSHVLPF